MLHLGTFPLSRSAVRSMAVALLLAGPPVRASADDAQLVLSRRYASIRIVSDPTQGKVLKVSAEDPTLADDTFATQSLGQFKAGETVEVTVIARSDGAGSLAHVDLLQMADGALFQGPAQGAGWQTLVFRQMVSTTGEVRVRLGVYGVTLQGAYFAHVSSRRLPPATVATGKVNLWPDPGFESVLGAGGGVSFAGSVSVAMEGTNRQGLHVLTLGPGGIYQRTVLGLDPAKTYLFSVWKKVGAGWTRSVSSGLQPNADGTLAITLNEVGSYDQAEMVEDPGTVPEAWIPESRRGRLDWFITDHLGSTRLLMDGSGAHRFTGDDDPYGLNVRSFGDSDAHRYTGQILDEDQGLYYYGARYYSPEVGRFLSADPVHEFHSPYAYVGNSPTRATDPDGMRSDWELDGSVGWTMPNLPPLTPEQIQAGQLQAERNETRFWGCLQAVGGVSETFAGGAFGTATSWTGIGAVAGGVVVAHGLDNTHTGAYTCFSSSPSTTVTEDLLTSAGMSPRGAALTNAGLSIVLSAGASSDKLAQGAVLLNNAKVGVNGVAVEMARVVDSGVVAGSPTIGVPGRAITWASPASEVEWAVGKSTAEVSKRLAIPLPKGAGGTYSVLRFQVPWRQLVMPTAATPGANAMFVAGGRTAAATGLGVVERGVPNYLKTVAEYLGTTHP